MNQEAVTTEEILLPNPLFLPTFKRLREREKAELLDMNAPDTAERRMVAHMMDNLELLRDLLLRKALAERLRKKEQRTDLESAVLSAYDALSTATYAALRCQTSIVARVQEAEDQRQATGVSDPAFPVLYNALTQATAAFKSAQVSYLAAYATFAEDELLRSEGRVCPGCGIHFIPKRADQVYHDVKCRNRTRQRRYESQKLQVSHASV